VPPPPVCGAAVGKAGVDAACVAACVGLWVAVAELDARAELDADAEADAEDDADGEVDACGEVDADDELDACGEPEDEAPPRAVEVALVDDPADGLELWPPFGDGVCVPTDDEEWPLPRGDGVKVPGTEEPPLVQADTDTARRTTPAPSAATGGVRRIFISPPRMPVR
jgi:hypothetical protein